MKYYIIPKEQKFNYEMLINDETKVIPVELENGDYHLPETVTNIIGYNIDLYGLELKEGNEITFKIYNEF